MFAYVFLMYVDYHMRAMRFNIFNKIFMNRRDEVSIHFVFPEESNFSLYAVIIKPNV